VIEKHLTRAQIAQFTPETVRSVWPFVISALTRQLPILNRPLGQQQREFVSGLLALGTRLVVRLDDAAARQLIEACFHPHWDVCAREQDKWNDLRSDAILEASHVVANQHLKVALRNQALLALRKADGQSTLPAVLSSVAANLDIERIISREEELFAVLCEAIGSGSRARRRTACFLLGLADKLGALDVSDAIKIGDLLWKDDVWPDIGPDVNRGFLVRWAGSRRTSALRRLVEEIEQETKNHWHIIECAALLSNRQDGENISEWLASANITGAVFAKISSALESTAIERKGTRSFGPIDHASSWRNALCALLAPAKALSKSEADHLLELARASDLWRPSAVVELFRWGYVDPPELTRAILTSPIAGDPQAEWDIANSIYAIFTAEEVPFQALRDKSNFLNVLTNQVRSLATSSGAHAMWVAAAIVEKRPGTVDENTCNTWLATVVDCSRIRYVDAQGDARDYLPDVRRASARLIGALVTHDPKLQGQSAIHEALQQFHADPLPEVRLQVAGLYSGYEYARSKENSEAESVASESTAASI
jgi:hypothetical protein